MHFRIETEFYLVPGFPSALIVAEVEVEGNEVTIERPYKVFDYFRPAGMPPWYFGRGKQLAAYQYEPFEDSIEREIERAALFEAQGHEEEAWREHRRDMNEIENQYREYRRMSGL
ncbi:MAG: hypothetical protein ABIH23_08400 [bacterium]